MSEPHPVYIGQGYWVPSTIAHRLHIPNPCCGADNTTDCHQRPLCIAQDRHPSVDLARRAAQEDE